MSSENPPVSREPGKGKISQTTAVFLHSFGGWAPSWKEVASKVSCPVIVPNLRGFGGSASPPGLYDVNSYVQDVLRLTDELESYILVGHSMGGKFAMATAARRPAGLKALVLVSPSTPVPEPMTESSRQKLLEGFGRREVAESTVAEIVKRPITDQDRATAIQGYLEVSRIAWDGWLEEGSREDISTQMTQVQVPVFLVAGTADQALGSAVQCRLTAPFFKDISLRDSQGSGHLVPIEDPDAIIGALIQAL